MAAPIVSLTETSVEFVDGVGVAIKSIYQVALSRCEYVDLPSIGSCFDWVGEGGTF